MCCTTSVDVLGNGVPTSKIHKWIWDWGCTSVFSPSIYKTLALSPSTPRKCSKSARFAQTDSSLPCFLDNWGLSISVESLIHETITGKYFKEANTFLWPFKVFLGGTDQQQARPVSFTGWTKVSVSHIKIFLTLMFVCLCACTHAHWTADVRVQYNP